jgi:gliding motility-associated-like protein
VITFQLSAVSEIDGTSANLVYEWEFKATAAGSYSPIGDAAGYSGTDENILEVNTTGGTGAGFYRCLVSSTVSLVSEYSEEAELTLGACTAPVITTQPLSTQIGGKVTIDLIPLITTEDLAALYVIEQPASGALASIDEFGTLTIDYTGLTFSGTESIVIEACDVNGLCTAEEFNVDVVGDVVVYNAVSPEGKNPILIFRYIETLPDTRENKVVIYNRWGDVVFEIDNYNNTTNTFAGVSSNGTKLPSGTYYYKVTFTGGRKSMTGFLELRY